MKIRKTLTNIKRIDRLKKTVAFLLFQVVLISLFCVFGIARTAHLTVDETTAITGKIENYSRHKRYSGRGAASVYFKVYIDGAEYKIGSYLTVSADEFEAFLEMSPIVTLRFNAHGEEVQLYSNSREYISLDKYNIDMRNWRITSIVLFSLTELISIAIYTVYMIFHRTSKDKRFL